MPSDGVGERLGVGVADRALGDGLLEVGDGVAEGDALAPPQRRPEGRLGRRELHEVDDLGVARPPREGGPDAELEALQRGRARRRWRRAGCGGGRSAPRGGSRGTAAPWSRSTSRRRPCRRRGRRRCRPPTWGGSRLGEALGGVVEQLATALPPRGVRRRSAAAVAVSHRPRTYGELDRAVKNVARFSRTRQAGETSRSQTPRTVPAHGDLRRPGLAARPPGRARPGGQPHRRRPRRRRRHRHPRAGRRPGHRRAGRRAARRRPASPLLVQEIGQVDGVDVEDVRPVADALHDPRLDALETAAMLVGAASTPELLDALCVHGARTVGAEWAVVVDSEAVEVLASTGPGAEPGVAGRLRRRQPVVGRRRRAPTAGPDDVVWAPLPGAGSRAGAREGGDGVPGPGAAPGRGPRPDRRHPVSRARRCTPPAVRTRRTRAAAERRQLTGVPGRA